MNERDAQDAAAGLRLGQRPALPVGNTPAIIPIEARELERLAVQLFDLGQRHAETDAVRCRPGRLVFRADHRAASRLDLAPDDFELAFRVLRIEHGRLDGLALGAVDVLVGQVAVAERLHQAGVAGVAAERPFAVDHPRRGRTLGPGLR